MLVKFSHTGEKLLPLGLGTHGLGHAFGGVDEKETMQIFELLSKSVNDGEKVLVDTAPRYGHGTVEKRLGKFISANIYPFVIATKGGRHITPDKDNQKEWTKSFLRQDLENSLKRLGVDNVFLYQLHNPDINVIKDGEVFSYLEEFRREGLISWYGVSINLPEEGIAAINVCNRNGLQGFAAIQVIYSVFHKGGLSILFDKAKQSNIAIISREVMMRGFFTGKYSIRDKFYNPPPAIQKIVDMYGVNALHNCVDRYRKIISGYKHYNLTMAQTAIAYSLASPDIAITLVGIRVVPF